MFGSEVSARSGVNVFWFRKQEIMVKLDQTMLKEMVIFLCIAKKKTYAAQGQEIRSSRMGSHDLMYEDGEKTYLDTYLGSERFTGEEAVWIHKQPL
jgi:hypothetical protein